MEFRFRVTFEGTQNYNVDAESEDEAFDKVAEMVNWDIPGLMWHEPQLLDRDEEDISYSVDGKDGF